MQQMMKQAQKMQQQIAAGAGRAGRGRADRHRRRWPGHRDRRPAPGELKAIKIDPKAVDPDDVETLEDLVRRGHAQRRRGGRGS